jgi:mannose-6-phosphate isomerase-like protein (cupin superfamily)
MTRPALALARAIAQTLPTWPLPVAAAAVDRAHLCHAAAVAVPNAGFVARPSRDYTAILAQAIAAAKSGPGAPVATALAAMPDGLAWYYSYAPRPGDADTADRIAFAELIGPDGPLMAPGCRVGFTLMAAGTDYAMHAHPAIELYAVIAGHAEWATPGAARRVPPGGLVLHPSNQPHAMRTLAEPLLALYGWRGDILSPPFYL